MGEPGVAIGPLGHHPQAQAHQQRKRQPKRHGRPFVAHHTAIRVGAGRFVGAAPAPPEIQIKYE
jgi:hypothetical protein